MQDAWVHLHQQQQAHLRFVCYHNKLEPKLESIHATKKWRGPQTMLGCGPFCSPAVVATAHTYGGQTMGRMCHAQNSAGSVMQHSFPGTSAPSRFRDIPRANSTLQPFWSAAFVEHGGVQPPLHPNMPFSPHAGTPAPAAAASAGPLLVERPGAVGSASGTAPELSTPAVLSCASASAAVTLSSLLAAPACTGCCCCCCISTASVT